MKKIAIVFLIVFGCNSIFAKMNLRVNVAAGPVFSDSEFQTLATGGTLDLNYDFNISQTDSISAGIFLIFIVLIRIAQKIINGILKRNFMVALHSGVRIMLN